MGILSNLQGAANAVTTGTQKAVTGRRHSASTDSAPGSTDTGPMKGEESETSVLDEEQGSIIMSMISQLRIGMDLSKVSFPTFVLEPRSMLERITDFMSHPELVFGAENVPLPEERFIKVLAYYLAGWHIKPKGVKKPYNPVLGEFFRCRYDYPNGTQAFYIAEQVSHHPPISAYFYISPANKLQICGELRPKSKFLGNSVGTTMEGENRVFLMGKPEDGEYILSLPNMYARGILFGSLILELGDKTISKSDKTGVSSEVEFKTKGFFSGTYNALAGTVKKGTTEIGAIDGRWSHTVFYTPYKNGAPSPGERRVLFDAATESKNVTQKTVAPESEQETNESRRLWSKLTAAIANRDMEAATTAKNEVEEAQREAVRQREAKGLKHTPRFFELRDGQWRPKIQLPEDPKEMIPAVQNWIWAPKPSNV